MGGGILLVLVRVRVRVFVQDTGSYSTPKLIIGWSNSLLVVYQYVLKAAHQKVTVSVLVGPYSPRVSWGNYSILQLNDTVQEVSSFYSTLNFIGINCLPQYFPTEIVHKSL